MELLKAKHAEIYQLVMANKIFLCTNQEGFFEDSLNKKSIKPSWFSQLIPLFIGFVKAQLRPPFTKPLAGNNPFIGSAINDS